MINIAIVFGMLVMMIGIAYLIAHKFGNKHSEPIKYPWDAPFQFIPTAVDYRTAEENARLYNEHLDNLHMQLHPPHTPLADKDFERKFIDSVFDNPEKMREKRHKALMEGWDMWNTNKKEAEMERKIEVGSRVKLIKDCNGRLEGECGVLLVNDGMSLSHGVKFDNPGTCYGNDVKGKCEMKYGTWVTEESLENETSNLMSKKEMIERYENNPTLLNALDLSVENWERKVDHWGEYKQVGDGRYDRSMCALCHHFSRKSSEFDKCNNCVLNCMDSKSAWDKLHHGREGSESIKYGIEIIDDIKRLRDIEKEGVEKEVKDKEEMAKYDVRICDLQEGDVFQFIDGDYFSRKGTLGICGIIDENNSHRYHSLDKDRLHLIKEYPGGNYGIDKTVKVKLLWRKGMNK